MSSPHSEVGPEREENLDVPSPHPTDVAEESGGEGDRTLPPPPSPDASGIELIEPSTVSRNPLGETRVSEPEEEENKTDSNEHAEDTDADARDVDSLPPEADQEQPPSLTSSEISAREGPVLVTECHTVYSVLTFAITSIYPILATYVIFAGSRYGTFSK
ncbi:hypothetical protein TrVE_jg2329 [Triparma verrucosa]|uniref:Transmembrane protein n=1 Tax=Triparma verrucosa TaxID=1606542 RepID=A0A9W7FE86_9STRA|nr:hypothetical protein TrVE_jg2329 [Triparma verrucosa]